MASDDELERQRPLDRLHRAGRAAWPELDVPREAFAAHVAERFPDGAGEGAPAADLYLACACAGGDARALSAFERAYFGDVDAAAAALRAPAGAADEVKQILRARFFVGGPARPPAILEYAGRGDLHGWVRISAARELLRLARRAQRDVPLDEAMLAELAPIDPETAALKARCGRELAAAFRAALAARSPRERTLLRYQLIDGLGVTEIGEIYRVHRATAARWLAQARDDLIVDVRRRLSAELRLSDAEARSLIRLVQSQLDLSLLPLLTP